MNGRMIYYVLSLVVLAGVGFYFLGQDIKEDLKHPEITLFNATSVAGCDEAYREAVTFCSTGDTNTFCVEQRIKELATCTGRVKTSDKCKPYVEAREKCKTMTDKAAMDLCKAQARTNTAWSDCHR